jgi:hypothetical protein
MATNSNGCIDWWFAIEPQDHAARKVPASKRATTRIYSESALADTNQEEIPVVAAMGIQSQQREGAVKKMQETRYEIAYKV